MLAHPALRQALVFLVAASAAPAQDSKLTGLLVARVHESKALGKMPYRLFRPEGYEKSGRRYPLVLFLHGAGERGDDNARQLIHGVGDFVSAANQAKRAAFVLAPQCGRGSWWSATLSLDLVFAVLDAVRGDYPIDPDRIYITGLSMGGYGTWAAIARRPELFAAAIPICGKGDPKTARELTGIPIWAFHGDADKAVPVEGSRAMVAAIEEAGGTPKYTEYPGVGHDSWTRTYADPKVHEWLFAQRRAGTAAPTACDVVVYGGTSAGVTAAVQAARMGLSVVLLEPGRHIGGLTSGGLGATDIGNKAAIGGLSRGFYQRVFRHYAKDESWTWQRRDQYRSRRQRDVDEAMWTFEPHVAEQVLRGMLAEHEVPVRFGQRLDLAAGVVKEGARIVSIRMESGQVLTGKVFIDATYEGDLMAKAGVSYTVGREANATHGETLNGVQTKNAVKHQFVKRVDPYVVPGRPESGLLPGITGEPLAADGTGDHRVQAYCFRMCITDVPENRAPWVKPAGYDEQLYELLLRNFAAGDLRIPWNPIWMPNRKTDTNNNFAVSTDFIGMSYEWPDGDYAKREELFRRHLSYQQGLLWTLAHHPRVPEKIRTHFQQFGPAKDEFTDHGNWPHQLYVREARRMVSDYVMSQHDCQGRRRADDPVGLAAYTMDSHNVQRHVDATGQVRNEGDVQVGGFPPYPIAYRSIRPRRAECVNLLVPVCLSASHIAYGSIRMEPVFMVLGQSAATAAAMAIAGGVPVQDVDLAALRARLLEDGQVLLWQPTARKAKHEPTIDPKTLPGIVLDDSDAELTGSWTKSDSTPGYVGAGYLHDDNAGKGEKTAVFTPKLQDPGHYHLRIAYPAHGNRASNLQVEVRHADGETTVTVDQKRRPTSGAFRDLGVFRFAPGSRITIANRGTDGYVVVDAIQLLPARR